MKKTERKTKKVSKKKFGTISLILMFLLTGCGTPIEIESGVVSEQTAETTVVVAETVSDTTVPTEAVTETTVPPEPVNLIFNPLTGTTSMNERAAGKRPVAVMVNNIKAALPQYGIEAADLLYELPVEGGITRMMAVYADYQGVPNVCSVRSCRYYYPILCLGMDAFYCHWGTDKTIALDTLNRTGIDHLDGGSLFGRIFFRDSDRLGKYASEHTGYLDGAKLGEYLEASGYRKERDEAHQDPMFRFVSEDAQFTPSEIAATTVSLRFSSAYFSTFTYDAEKGVYLKQHSGSPQIDQHTGNQLSFENVFILQTDIHPREDNYLMDVALTEGTGYYAANGGMQTITWRKESETAPIRVYQADGAELQVNPGKSYIGIIGFDAPVTYS